MRGIASGLDAYLDLHLVVLLLILTIFALRAPNILGSVLCVAVPLQPMIGIRTLDHRHHWRRALAYLFINELLVVGACLLQGALWRLAG